MLSILISSTFNDMQAERDIIHTVVAPRLRRVAARFGESVRLLDLRWGVNTQAMSEEAAAQKVLDVCLDEIDRCDGYMVCLLGRRYGWVPDYSMVTSVDSHGIRMETPISVTELEIQYGILQRNLGEKAVVFFRDEITGLPEDMEGQYCDPAGDTRLSSLKARLEALPGCTCQHYALSYLAPGEFGGIDDFAQRLLSSLTALLERVYGQAKSLSPTQRQERIFQSFIREQSDTYLPVPVLEQALAQFQAGDDSFLVVQAEAGMGKSAFAARVCAGPPEAVRVIPYFCGAGALQVRPDALLRYYVEQLCLLTGAAPPGADTSFQEMAAYFTGLLYEIREPVWFVADGLERLRCPPEDILSWLPNRLPEHVRFLITAAPGNSACRQLGEFWPVQYVTIPPLDRPDRFILRLLAASGKEIPAALAEKAGQAKLSGNYLYITMVIQMLMLLDRHDFADINRRGGGIDVINAYIRGKLDQLPDSLEAMGFLLMYDCGEQVAPGMAGPFLSAISASPVGLRAQDLEALFPKLWDELAFQRFTAFLDGFLEEDENGCYQFTRPVLQQASFQVLSPELLVQITDYLEKLPDDDPVKISAGLKMLLAGQRYPAAEALIRANPDAQVLQEQLLEALLFFPSEVFQLLLSDPLLDWFLDQLTPRLTDRQPLLAAIRLLKNRPSPQDRSLQMRLLKTLGELYVRNGQQRPACEVYLRLRPLVEGRGDPVEIAGVELKIAVNTFVDSEAEREAIYDGLSRTISLYEAQPALPPEAQTELLQARFCQELLELQECFFRISGSAKSLYSKMYRQDSNITYLDTILHMGLHAISGVCPSEEMAGGLLRLCALCGEVLSCLEDSGWSGDKADCWELLLTCFTAMVRVDSTAQPLETDGFSPEQLDALQRFRTERRRLMERARQELTNSLRKTYQVQAVKQLARLNVLLSRVVADVESRKSLLEHSCQTWERYFSRTMLPDFSGSFAGALQSLAALYLADKRYQDFADTLEKWGGVQLCIARAETDAARRACARYPDEIHQQELERARRKLSQVWREYNMQLWLKEDYAFQSGLEDIFSVAQYAWQQQILSQEVLKPITPELFRYELRLALELQEEMERPHTEAELLGLRYTWQIVLWTAYRMLMMLERQVSEDAGDSWLHPARFYASQVQFIRRYLEAIGDEDALISRGSRLCIAFQLALSQLCLAAASPTQVQALAEDTLDLLAALRQQLPRETDVPATWIYPALSHAAIDAQVCRAHLLLADETFDDGVYAQALPHYKMALDLGLRLYGGKENTPAQDALHFRNAAHAGLRALECMEALDLWDQMGELGKKLELLKSYRR